MNVSYKYLALMSKADKEYLAEHSNRLCDAWLNIKEKANLLIALEYVIFGRDITNFNIDLDSVFKTDSKLNDDINSRLVNLKVLIMLDDLASSVWKSWSGEFYGVFLLACNTIINALDNDKAAHEWYKHYPLKPSFVDIDYWNSAKAESEVCALVELFIDLVRRYTRNGFYVGSHFYFIP